MTDSTASDLLGSCLLEIVGEMSDKELREAVDELADGISDGRYQAFRGAALELVNAAKASALRAD